MARVRASFSRIDCSTMPNGDWVMRRRTRYASATTAKTNQCRVTVEKRALKMPGMLNGGCVK